jgi:hypothetical protein
MIKIPNSDSRFQVQNGPEVKPNIAFTRNVNFDEEGYIKQSSPLIKVYDESQAATFGAVSDIIDTQSTVFKIITDDEIFDLELDNLEVAVDAGAPDGQTTSRVAGWGRGDILTDTSDGISQYDESADAWIQRNNDSVGFLTEFPSRQTWVAEASGGVNQYAIGELDDNPLSTTSTGPDLELPNYYTVTGLAYSNYRIGVATEHENGGQAMFFTWDGASASANTGTPVDAPIILDVCHYKNSWVVLTSRGQLLYFNGGGWDTLGDLPPYYFNVVWIQNGGSVQYGSILHPDGDIIYINIGSQLEADEDDSGILPYFYSGVWCYDPMVGLYHRHTLSYSTVRLETPSLASGVWTASTAHYLQTGDKVFRTSNDQMYYAIRLNAATFSLADSYDLAIAGTVGGATSGELMWVERKDFGQLNWYNNVTGCVKSFDNPSTEREGISAFFAGGFLQTPALAAEHTLCARFNKFDTISTIIYSRYKSTQKEDIYNSINVKYKPLKDGDKIVVKYKVKDKYDIKTLGEAGDATPDTGFITWTNGTTFTFTNAMLNATDVEVGDEVEIQSGAAAGQSSHISSITLASGTWTVVLEDSLRGAEAGKKSTIMIDSYQKLGVITKDSANADTDNTNLRLDKKGKFIQVKLELIGSHITIEELAINNQENTPIN